MYAIIRDGGRQMKVEEGQELLIDYRADATPGQALLFEEVLAIGDGAKFRLGQPLVAGASVPAEVIETQQGKKLTIQKFRRRKTFRRKTGFRAMHTKVRIGKIAGV